MSRDIVGEFVVINKEDAEGAEEMRAQLREASEEEDNEEGNNDTDNINMNGDDESDHKSSEEQQPDSESEELEISEEPKISPTKNEKSP
ncbi:MAG: hypothetical protein ACMG6E_02840 [Candidatus Roizmanbacteria bacterium]